MAWKPVALGLAVAGVVSVAPVMVAPAWMHSQAVAQTRIAANRNLTLVIVNNAGVPIMAGISGSKGTMIAAGKSTTLAFPSIKSYTQAVNVLVYHPGGANLVFRTTGVNSSSNTLTVTVTSTKSNSAAVHGSISIGPDGIVRFI